MVRAGFDGAFVGAVTSTDSQTLQVSAPKMAEVVCAQNLFKRTGGKPILQATLSLWSSTLMLRLAGAGVVARLRGKPKMAAATSDDVEQIIKLGKRQKLNAVTGMSKMESEIFVSDHKVTPAVYSVPSDLRLLRLDPLAISLYYLYS
jgi:hypothetical protein